MCFLNPINPVLESLKFSSRLAQGSASYLLDELNILIVKLGSNNPYFKELTRSKQVIETILKEPMQSAVFHQKTLNRIQKSVDKIQSVYSESLYQDDFCIYIPPNPSPDLSAITETEDRKEK